MSLSLKTISTRSLFCLMLARQIPNKIAKKITCNIFPSTKDLNGFSGIIFKKTDAIEGGDWRLTLLSLYVAETELPGSRKVPTVREIVIAVSVVKMYKLIVLMPILPKELILFKFATPLTNEKNNRNDKHF